jgi:hypothetical protein
MTNRVSMPPDLVEVVRARALNPSTRIEYSQYPPPLPQPASANAILSVEAVLGWPLPTIVREVYQFVANGGFGPGYGIVGLPGGARNAEGLHLPGLYQHYLTTDPHVPLWVWPDRLLPFCDWGCAIVSCVDCNDPLAPVVTFDPEFWSPDGKDPLSVAMARSHDSLAAWLADWASGRQIWLQMYEAIPQTQEAFSDAVTGVPVRGQRKTLKRLPALD